MCTVSMVMDHFGPRISPWIGDPPYRPNLNPPLMRTPSLDKFFESIQDRPSFDNELRELRTLIAEFREALTAAKRLDVLIHQPDCVDPKKAELEAHIKALEKALAARPRKRKARK